METNLNQNPNTNINPNPYQNRKSSSWIKIATIIAGILIVTLLIIIVLVSDKPSSKPLPDAVGTTQATSDQTKVFQKYLTDNKFEGVTTAGPIQTINGIYSGYSQDKITLLTTQGNFTFPVSSTTLITTENLTPDPANPRNQIFTHGQPYYFKDFVKTFPFGIVVQVNYTSANGANKPSSIDAYVQQIAK